jgi:tetratricopeptide (TPR) repeat protein
MMRKKIIVFCLALLFTILSVVGYYFYNKHQAETLRDKAEHLYKQSDWKAALVVYNMLKDDYLLFLSPFEQAGIYIGIGNCLFEIDRYSDSINFYSHAATIVDSNNLLIKLDAPTQLYERWGIGYEAEKNYPEAERIYKDGIKAISRIWGYRYTGLFILKSRLGSIYLLTGQYHESLVNLLEVYNNKEFWDEQEEHAKALFLGKLGAAYCHNEDYENAEKIYERCLYYTRKSFGDDSRRLAIEYVGLAMVLHKQNQTSKAVMLLEKSYTYFKNNYGEQDNATKRIADLLDEWKNTP